MITIIEWFYRLPIGVRLILFPFMAPFIVLGGCLLGAFIIVVSAILTDEECRKLEDLLGI